MRNYDVNSQAFDDLSEEESAYWFGFLFADGTVARTNIAVALGIRDHDHLRKLSIFLTGQDRTITFKTRGGSEKVYKAVRLTMSDRALADRLRLLGVEPHRPNAIRALRSVPKRTVHHFLRGWFDGDGSAHLMPQLTFCGKPDFLKAVALIFQRRAGANPVTLKAPQRRSPSLVYRGVYRCGAIVDFLYNEATVYLARKRDRIAQWPEPQRAKADRFCPTCGHAL